MDRHTYGRLVQGGGYATGGRIVVRAGTEGAVAKLVSEMLRSGWIRVTGPDDPPLAVPAQA